MKITNRKHNRWTALLLLLGMLFSRPGLPVFAMEAADSLETGVEASIPAESETAEETREEESTEIPLRQLLQENTVENARTDLVVGVTTPMDGKFFTGMWGRRTTDIDMRILLHGYNLIRWNGEMGFFEADPAVAADITAVGNQEGDRSFIISLQPDLFYSDGTRITAWDYAFSLLFGISPEIAELGGIPEDRSCLLGYEEYLEERTRRKEAAEERAALLAAAEAQGVEPPEEALEIPPDPAGNPLPGVRVLADDILMLTIRHEYLPYFYEMGLLLCQPYPIQTLAPGTAVRDDGAGVYLTNIVEDADEDERRDELLYTKELLQETIFNEETGYMNHPAVVSGPYKMISWDGEKAELERNEYYKDYTAYLRFIETVLREQAAAEETAEEESTEESSTEETEESTEETETSEKTETVAVLEKFAPFIEHLTVLYVDDNTAVDRLDKHEIDLVNKVTKAETVQQGILLVGDRERYGEFHMSSYPRNGLSYISYCCEQEKMTLAVRRALAYCMDRDEVVRDYTGSNGLRVDGFYGIGQWMVGLVNGTTPPPVNPPEDENDAEAELAYEEELAAWEALSLDGLNPYPLDEKTAEEILEADGWHVNKETGIREKWILLTEEELAMLESIREDLRAAQETSDREPTEEELLMQAAELAGMEIAWDEEGRIYRVLRLELVMAYPEGNTAADSFEENWLPWLEEAGVRMTLLPMEYDEMMRLYYDWDDRSEKGIDMYYLASNFDVLFDPLVYFYLTEPEEETEEEAGETEETEETEEAGASPEEDTEEELRKATWSYTNFEDPELYELALDMRRTEPGKVLEYLQKWVAFQERFNDRLPILPIYSNVYFDFYSSDLHRYTVSENVAWSSGITEARVYEEETTAEDQTGESEEEEFFDDGGTFEEGTETGGEDGLIELD